MTAPWVLNNDFSKISLLITYFADFYVENLTCPPFCRYFLLTVLYASMFCGFLHSMWKDSCAYNYFECATHWDPCTRSCTGISHFNVIPSRRPTPLIAPLSFHFPERSVYALLSSDASSRPKVLIRGRFSSSLLPDCCRRYYCFPYRPHHRTALSVLSLPLFHKVINTVDYATRATVLHNGWWRFAWPRARFRGEFLTKFSKVLRSRNNSVKCHADNGECSSSTL